MITLFESETHKNVMFNDLTSGAMVQANQHVILNGQEGIVLDPGGHKVFSKLISEIPSVIPNNGLKYIFFSHQDPDIIAAANGWLMVTEAQAYLSQLWMGYILHFGVDELVADRINPIPDEGMTLRLDGEPLKIIAAHFLHSPGNFQVYDTVSKILYSGDIGSSFGNDYDMVQDFDAHIQYIEEFHERYITSTKALKMWVEMARTIDIDIIAPQHGAIFPNNEMADRFIDWADNLTCGIDLMEDAFVVPD
ncbi:MAG TPA: MBL fold metallo-hydrolase [Desulfobacteraceae bacterium]|nr:MBL fold metallo-hydrolase [Desulfobacteraceae bacterium]